MIIKKQIESNSILKIEEPLGYEFDTDSCSIVLLNNYRYELYYSNHKVIDQIDLREKSNE